jgi:CzcA family heavy metal efflux pump
MWIVRLALRRPYFVAIMALLIGIFGAVSIVTTPTDILPDISIPIVSVIWTYNGLAADDMSKRIVGVCERSLSTTVTNIEHVESQSYSGVGVIKIYFQPDVQVDLAMAQVTSLSQSILKNLPPGILPPQILKYDASSVPIVQLSLGGRGLSQEQLYDYGQNFIRTQLENIKGASLPLPYGGEVRSIMVDVDPTQLAAYHLSTSDVSAALGRQNLIAPSGTQKMGDREYLIGTNASPSSIKDLNDLPIRAVNGTLVTIRDVSFVHDGYQPQTNLVRENGVPSALLTVIKNGAASTLTIVKQIKQHIPSLKMLLPPQLTITPIFDQSLIVSASVRDVVQEAITAAFLTAVMILVFLGSWRSTLIVSVSIPLAVLFSIAVTSALGETINVMTLGGLALAVGMLVDDATVEIENTHRNLGEGDKKPLAAAILESAEQVASPALAATLSLCIVFVPVTLLSGPAKYIFTPLALSVVLALLASYGLSRTLVPTMMHMLLRAEVPLYQGGDSPLTRSWIWRVHVPFERGFDRLHKRYESLLKWSLEHRAAVLILFAIATVGSALLIFVVGEDFFPYVDSGQMEFHVRPPAGTRIETASEVLSRVDAEIRRIIPSDQITMIVDNIGLPPGGINLAYSSADTTSDGDADVLVELAPKHRPTQEWMQTLREDFAKEFPQEVFFFEPADITNQTLNFGSPAPIDVQIRGKDASNTYQIAAELRDQIKTVPGAADVFIQQEVSSPKLNVDVDRLKAQELSLTMRDVSDDVLLALSGSGQTAPNFWMDPQTGIEYPVIVQVPQLRLHNLDSLSRLSIAPPTGNNEQLLGNIADFKRVVSPVTVSHYDNLPVMNVYANTQQRDLGGVSRDIQKIINRMSFHLPAGTTIAMSGQVATMNNSFFHLGIGIIAAILFVYLLLSFLFQSWTDPLIILMALPAAFAGIVWALFLTQTSLNVPSLMGALMTIGVATSNSILVVVFANENRAGGKTAVEAALKAGTTRLRPVCMTALAMVLGMLPMSLALGEGGEQNAPIGRAVIGGLLFATVGTLIIVPIIYSLLRKHPPVNFEERLEQELKGATHG